MLKSICKMILKSMCDDDEYCPGTIDFGDLRRLTPFSREYGYERGLPVDRYYIEQFLCENSEFVKGRVLEIGDDSYCRKFGGDRVRKCDVLNLKDDGRGSIVGDLTDAPQLESCAYDCLIVPQTLQFIYDVKRAVATMKRILKPGGVALVTVPGISQLSVDEWAPLWCWSFTATSMELLFSDFVSKDNMVVTTYGNVLTSTAFLQGIPSEELLKEELDERDPLYQLLITVKVEKMT